MTHHEAMTGERHTSPPVTIITNAARFALGQIVATPGALALLERKGFSAAALSSRHAHGDCCAEHSASNKLALAATPRDKRIALPTVWIITESYRNVTTLLRPKEYGNV